MGDGGGIFNDVDESSAPLKLGVGDNLRINSQHIRSFIVARATNPNELENFNGFEFKCFFQAGDVFAQGGNNDNLAVKTVFFAAVKRADSRARLLDVFVGFAIGMDSTAVFADLRNREMVGDRVQISLQAAVFVELLVAKRIEQPGKGFLYDILAIVIIFEKGSGVAGQAAAVQLVDSIPCRGVVGLVEEYVYQSLIFGCHRQNSICGGMNEGQFKVMQGAYARALKNEWIREGGNG